jgi:hypothetical protein
MLQCAMKHGKENERIKKHRSDSNKQSNTWTSIRQTLHIIETIFLLADFRPSQDR